MLEGFWEDESNNGNIVYGRYESLRFKYTGYINKVISYYSTSSQYVKRPNELITIINSLGINFNKSYLEVFDDISNNSSYISNNVGIINTTNKNDTPLNGCIVNDMDEFLLLDDSSFDFSSYDSCLTPIKCIYTTLDNNFLTHPKKFTDTLSDDYSVYKVNSNMLGMAFYYWGKRQIFLERDTDIGRFLYEVVLTNTISSINDLALFNRFIKLKHSLPVRGFVNDNPFETADFDDKVDKMFAWINSHYKKHNVPYSSYLVNIPLLSSRNCLEVMDINIGYYNKRNKWIIWLSRLPIIIFLLENIDSKNNKDTINDLEVELGYAYRNRVFDLKDDKSNTLLNGNIKKIKELIGV